MRTPTTPIPTTDTTRTDRTPDTSKRRKGRRGLVAVAAVTASLASLASLTGVAAAGPRTATVAADPPREVTVDWVARTVSLEPPAGWTVDFCEGEAPFVCVERGGRHAGVVELIEARRSSVPRLAHGHNLQQRLTQWARAFARDIAADRAEGCEDGYRVVADEPTPAIVAGTPGIRYSFTGYGADGDAAERTVGHAVIRGQRLFILGASAYEADGCLGNEGSEFTVADLRAFEPTLGRLAAGSKVEAPALRDGTHTGYLRNYGEGWARIDVADLLTGDEAVRAARAAGAIGQNETLDTDWWIRNPSRATATLTVAHDARASVVRCDPGCEPHQVPIADFLGRTARPFGGRNALFEVVVRNGDIVSISEIYLA